MERHVKGTGDGMHTGQGILGKGKHGVKHEQILPTSLRRNYPCQEFSSTIVYFSTVRYHVCVVGVTQCLPCCYRRPGS